MQKVQKWWPYLDPLVIGSIQIWSVVVGYQIYTAFIRGPWNPGTAEEDLALQWRFLSWIVIQLLLAWRELISERFRCAQFVVGLAIPLFMGSMLLGMIAMRVFIDHTGMIVLMVAVFPILRAFSIGTDITRRWRRSYQRLQQA